MQTAWQGVFPAATTLFRDDQAVDLPGTARHLDRLIRAGVHGLIVLGTVGENSSLEYGEKLDVLRASVQAVRGRVPLISGVAEGSTRLACRFAQDAEKTGVDGLMVLPAMVYRSDPRETLAHFRTVARASRLPILCYNNPVTYGVDITPEMFADLADEKTLVAIKESSDNVRRITDLINLLGTRYRLFNGVDDLALESAMLGADGWVAGLVNALPAETVRLWALARRGRFAEARALYRWFSPLLHLDTHPKLVQCIKLVMAECDAGPETVRAPRLPLQGEERRRILGIVRTALRSRPGKKTNVPSTRNGR